MKKENQAKRSTPIRGFPLNWTWFRVWLAAGCLAWLPASSLADGLEEGYRALVRGSLAEAVTWFTQEAEQGNRYAQYNLGVLFLEGVGVEPDLVMAYVWFQRAAKRGDPLAQKALNSLTGLLSPAQLLAAREKLQSAPPARTKPVPD